MKWSRSETPVHKHQAVLSMIRAYSLDGRGGSMAGVELLLHSKAQSFHNVLGPTITQLVFRSLPALNKIPALLLLLAPGPVWLAGYS